MTTTPPLTNAQLVCMVGQALYGERWMGPLSRDLDVIKRTVERVAEAAGQGLDYPAARAWLPDLARLVAERQPALRAAAALLDARAA